MKGTKVMKDYIFGVKSKAPANKKLSNGYTLFDWTIRTNCPPKFWARSITGENKVTTDELEFLASKGCRLALILDDLSEESVSYENGKADAQRAIDAVKEIGVPDTTDFVIFACIEDSWSVNHNWMIDFDLTLLRNGYKAGFIGNTDSSVNFNFDRQFSHLINVGCEAVCWATAPLKMDEPEEWAPYAPSAIEPEDVMLWQIKTEEYKNIPYGCIYGKDKSALDFMWLYSKKEEE